MLITITITRLNLPSARNSFGYERELTRKVSVNLIEYNTTSLVSLSMAKKKNSNKTAGEPSDGATIAPSPGISPSPASTRPKDAKAPQHSASALIICRNKYVFQWNGLQPAIDFMPSTLWIFSCDFSGKAARKWLTATDAEAFFNYCLTAAAWRMRVSGDKC